MAILQGGVPKCGNFWLYQIIQGILKHNGQPARSFISQHPIAPLASTWQLNFPDQWRVDVLDITDLQCSYRISSIFKMPISDLTQYIASTDHVWTHAPICKKSDEVMRHFSKKVYIIRDPRDRAISASRYYCSDYMLRYFPQKETEPGRFLEKNLYKLMHEWVWHVWDHLRLREQYDILICFYENFKTDFRQELDRLLRYLELELSDEQKANLEYEVSFHKLKESNPKHLRKGGTGYWTEKLNDQQKALCSRMAAPLLQVLGYGLDKPEHSHQLQLAPMDADRLREELIAGMGLVSV